MTPVPIHLLEAMAVDLCSTSVTDSFSRLLDLRKWIKDSGLDVDGPKPWMGGGRRWVLQVCPWNADHSDRSAFIVQLPNGAISAGCLHNSCKGQDWHALRNLVEPRWRENPEPHDVPDTSGGLKVRGWEAPTPFQRFDVPPFPSTSLPEWLHGYVDAVAIATQTPVDLAAMLALSVIAISCAKKVIVRMKEGYCEPVNVYTVTALPSGNRKSQVFRTMIEPVQEFESSEAHRQAPEIARRNAAYKIREAQLKRAEEQAANATSRDKEELAEIAGQFAVELAEFDVPTATRLMVSDCTVEMLAVILRQQGGRIAVMSPEGGEIFGLMSGRYTATKEGNFEAFLKGHTGEPIRVDRVGRTSVFIDSPAITMGLTVQPEVIRSLISKQGFRGRGLLARNLYSMPVSLLGRRDTDAPSVPIELQSMYAQKVLSLLRLPFVRDKDTKSAPFVLQFSDEAMVHMRHFERWIEPQLSEFGELGAMTDWGGKLFGAVGRIAGLLHMAEHAGAPTPWEIRIDLKTVEWATEIGRYLIPHAKAAFDLMGSDAATVAARKIVRWLERHDEPSISKRDLHQGLRGTFKRVEDLERPLEALIRNNYIRQGPEPYSAGRGRPPSPVYDLNPLWTRETYARSHGNFEVFESFENTQINCVPEVSEQI